jgi:hypothetical protein
MERAILLRRFPGKFFKYSIELRERLKTDRKCDFTHSKIDIFQEFLSSLETNPRDVIDELYSGYLFEFFAEMRRIDANCFRDFVERQFFGRVFLNEFSRLPNIARLGEGQIVGRGFSSGVSNFGYFF